MDTIAEKKNELKGSLILPKNAVLMPYGQHHLM
jgi:hypothetical protein